VTAIDGLEKMRGGRGKRHKQHTRIGK